MPKGQKKLRDSRLAQVPARAQPQCFHVELSDFDIAEEDLMEVFGRQLKARSSKRKTSLMKILRVNEFGKSAREHRGTGLVQAARRRAI